MMALEQTEDMERTCEASLKCLHKGFPYNLQCNGSPIEGFPNLKVAISNHPVGDVPESDRPLGSEFLEPPTESHNKPNYHHDFGYWSTFHYDSQKVQQCQMNAFESQLYPYPMENRFHYAPFNMFAQSYPNDFRFQDFQYFVVIDFEATCDKDRNPHPQEIIEFPSVIVSSMTGQLEACFQTYVRPTCNQLLSDFCKDLTGIQQIQVDRGVTLGEALLRHDKWLEKKGIKNTNFAVVTWSNWDCRVMLESECRFKKIRKPPYFNRWINLKVPFREVFGCAFCFQGGDPIVRDEKRSISRDLVRFLEFIDGVVMKGHGLSLKAVKNVKGVKNVRFGQNVNKSRVLPAKCGGDLGRDQREKIENLRHRIEKIRGFARVAETDQEDVELEGFQHDSDEDEENLRLRFKNGVLVKGHGLQPKVKKNVSFAENGNVYRVFSNSDEPVSSRDGSDSSDDHGELVENRCNEVEEVKGIAQETEEDEEEAHTENGESPQASSDGERNPRARMTPRRADIYETRGRDQGQNEYLLFSAPLPVKMESKADTIKRNKAVKL